MAHIHPISTIDRTHLGMPEVFVDRWQVNSWMLTDLGCSVLVEQKQELIISHTVFAHTIHIQVREI